MKNLNLTVPEFSEIPEQHFLHFGYPKEGPFRVKATWSDLSRYFKDHEPFHVATLAMGLWRPSLRDLIDMTEKKLEAHFKSNFRPFVSFDLVGRHEASDGSFLKLRHRALVKNGRKLYLLIKYANFEDYHKDWGIRCGVHGGRIIRKFRRLPRKYITNLEGWERF